MLRSLTFFAAAMLFGLSPLLNAHAQDTKREALVPISDKVLVNDVDQQEMRYAKFKNLFTGAKLRGQFTIDGKPMNDLKQEAYEIVTVEKLPEGDQWAITARIKYGKYDVTVPVPLDVKWAGDTPVLTLDNLTIPTMGTFSARVVLHQDKYAGTWQHDSVGGHMFGMIEIAKGNSQPPAETEDAKL